MIDVACPSCGEAEALAGRRSDAGIDMSCETCGHAWRRATTPRCPHCGRSDLRTVPLAIVEKGRGTQLSIVGTRPIHLCVACDAAVLDGWQRNRPNPLMPDDLPTA